MSFASVVSRVALSALLWTTLVAEARSPAFETAQTADEALRALPVAKQSPAAVESLIQAWRFAGEKAETSSERHRALAAEAQALVLLAKVHRDRAEKAESEANGKGDELDLKMSDAARGLLVGRAPAKSGGAASGAVKSGESAKFAEAGREASKSAKFAQSANGASKSVEFAKFEQLVRAQASKSGESGESAKFTQSASQALKSTESVKFAQVANGASESVKSAESASGAPKSAKFAESAKSVKSEQLVRLQAAKSTKFAQVANGAPKSAEAPKSAKSEESAKLEQLVRSQAPKSVKFAEAGQKDASRAPKSAKFEQLVRAQAAKSTKFTQAASGAPKFAKSAKSAKSAKFEQLVRSQVAKSTKSTQSASQASKFAQSAIQAPKSVKSTRAQSPRTHSQPQRSVVTPPPARVLSDRFRVVLDPGHGGRDHGAPSRWGPEKDVNLAIAKVLATRLRAVGVSVVLTRDGDQSLSLEARSELANRSHGDLFVSIHANSSPKAEVHGLETFHLNTASDRYADRLEARARHHGAPRKTQDLNVILADLQKRSTTALSQRLAEHVQRESVRQIQRVRPEAKSLGVKSALFHVLLGVKMPAILVETGFLTHAKEGPLLHQKAYQAQLAQGIFEGIQAYRRQEAQIARREARSTKGQFDEASQGS